MGRTKGGLNTKLSAVVDARGRVLAVSLAPGQQHDQHAVIPVLACVRHRRVVADKGFDSDIFCTGLRAPLARCWIPPGSVAAGTRPASIAVTTNAAIRLRTSSAALKPTAASASVTASWPAPSSASSNSPPSWIGSLMGFEDTPCIELPDRRCLS